MWGKSLLLALVLGFASGVAEARDPFAEPVDPCGTQHVSLWIWRGVIGHDEKYSALFQEAGGRWVRVRAGSELQKGVRIISITRSEAIATAGGACPQPLRWVFQEKYNEGNHRVAVISGTASQRGENGK